MQTWLVTGGAGFIGANFVLAARQLGLARVINLDLLTYAGHPENFARLKGDRDHVFVQGDIGDEALTAKLLAEHRPDAVVNFAAESRRPLDSRAAGLHSDQYRRHAHTAGRRAQLLAGTGGGGKERLPISACFDR